MVGGKKKLPGLRIQILLSPDKLEQAKITTQTCKRWGQFVRMVFWNNLYKQIGHPILGILRLVPGIQFFIIPLLPILMLI